MSSTVLVIDDDATFLNDASNMLAENGYQVLCASTGTEAIEHLERKRGEIALTIVDLALPDVNGFELIGAISRRANSIKVLATTGIYRDTHLEAAATLGADAALRKPPHGKPIPRREWLETVERLIGKAGGDRSVSAGDSRT